MQARMLEGCQPKRVGHSRLPRQEGRSRILARSIAACCNEQTAMGTHRKERWRFLPSHKWRRVPTPRFYGGVGAPVGLTVFKTAEGSLGAVPGGFDSHTPLPLTFRVNLRIPASLRHEMRFHSNSEKSKKWDSIFSGITPK